MDNEDGLPNGPPGSRSRRELERRRARNRQQPNSERPEITRDESGRYRVWNCYTEYGPYDLQTARRMLSEWRQQLRAEASIRNRSPLPKPHPKTEPMSDGECWAPFTACPLVSQDNIEAQAKQERQAIRRPRTTKANREKQPKAMKASNEARLQAKAERQEQARGLWHRLDAQGVPTVERCRIIAERMSLTIRTVRRYLK